MMMMIRRCCPLNLTTPAKRKFEINLFSRDECNKMTTVGICSHRKDTEISNKTKDFINEHHSAKNYLV